MTITIGLLIALGLEGLVEWRHHRHLVHEAHTTIKHEIESNRHNLQKNVTALRDNEQRIQNDIKTLLSLRAGNKLNKGSLEYHVDWSELNNTAWKTAQSTGALSYMDYQDARELTEVYDAQSTVSAGMMESYKGALQSIAPLFISSDPNLMTKEEVQLSLQRSADLLMELKSLEQLSQQLDQQYEEQIKRMD